MATKDLQTRFDETSSTPGTLDRFRRSCGGPLVTATATLASACLVALTSAPLMSAPASAALQERLVPANGAYFGAAVPDTAGMTQAQEVQDYENNVGRKLDFERVYKRLDDPWIDDALRWNRDNNRDTILSINSMSKDGTMIRWSDIADGRYDAMIRQQADAVKAFNAPLWLGFNHEPEDDTASGGPAEFVAAWRHIVDLFRAQGVDNVTWTWIMMAYSFRSVSPRQASTFYPGDDYVDVIAADGYNWYTCDGRNVPWSSFRDIFSDFHAFGVSHNKPEIIAEYGSAEDDAVPGRKAQWLRDIPGTLQAWPEVKAVSYWGPTNTCFNYKSSTSAAQALAELGSQSYLRLRPQAALTASASEGASPLAVTFNGSDSASPRGALAQWTFDPGDGTPALTGVGNPPAALPHTYSATGTSPSTFTAKLTVVDTNGRTDWRTVPVTADPAPIATTAGATPDVASADISGRVDPNGLATTYYVQYGATTAYGSRTAGVSLPAGDSPAWVTASLTGLTPVTTYHYRLVAVSGAGTSYGDDKTFTTYGPASVTTWSVGDFAPGAATVRGSVDPNGLATRYRLEYGPTTSYGNATAWTDGGSNTWATSVAVPLTGLSNVTTYHYRLAATNSAGTTYSDDKTFTSAGPADVRTDWAGSISSTGASINGWVDSNELATTYYFQYGTTTGYGSTTASAQTKVMWGASVPATTLTGLRSKTLYHYRIVGTNAAGRTYGLDRTFTTQ